MIKRLIERHKKIRKEFEELFPDELENEEDTSTEQRGHNPAG